MTYSPVTEAEQHLEAERVARAQATLDEIRRGATTPSSVDPAIEQIRKRVQMMHDANHLPRALWPWYPADEAARWRIPANTLRRPLAATWRHADNAPGWTRLPATALWHTSVIVAGALVLATGTAIGITATAAKILTAVAGWPFRAYATRPERPHRRGAPTLRLLAAGLAVGVLFWLSVGAYGLGVEAGLFPPPAFATR